MTIKEQIERAKIAEMLTVEQVALLLNFHPGSVYRMAQRGTIPGLVRCGRSLRFKRTVVLSWGRAIDRPAI